MSAADAGSDAVTSHLNVMDSAHFHISSVRTLATYVTSSSVLIFSAGGRGQLCAWATDITSRSSVIGRLQWLANHTHHMTWRRRKSTSCELADQPDIRYMKVTTFSASDLDPGLPADLFILAVACSDGFMRLLVFDRAARQFSDVAKSDFHGSCVLQVTHVIYWSYAAKQNSAIILSAGTDGRICVWDVTDVVRCFLEKYCLQFQHLDNYNNTPLLTRCASPDATTISKSFSSLSKTDFAQQCDVNSSLKTEACDTLASFVSCTSSRITDSSERQDDSEETKACERHGCQLEPCCVIIAHQSGVNSLAVRLRLSGYLCFHHDYCLSRYQWLTSLVVSLLLFVEEARKFQFCRYSNTVHHIFKRIGAKFSIEYKLNNIEFVLGVP